MLNKLLLFFLKLLMAVLFFLVITPTGVILKIIGVDYLRLKKNKNNVTFWQKRK